MNNLKFSVCLQCLNEVFWSLSFRKLSPELGTWENKEKQNILPVPAACEGL